MPNDIISKKTRLEFREFLVGWTLGQIEMEFEAADIACSLDYEPNVAGQRRSLVEQYYRSLDFASPDDVRKLLKVYENILATLDGPHSQDSWLPKERQANLTRLTRWLRKDGFAYDNGRIAPVAGIASMPHIKSIATAFDADYLATQIERINQAVETDPRLAIGTAKELVETTCKTILSERQKSVDPKSSLSPLLRATLHELKLAPDNIPQAAKAADTIKLILGNLANITQGLAELRNPYGTGHGPDGRARGLQPRHARLAAGAAITLATFLFDTHQDKNQF